MALSSNIFSISSLVKISMTSFTAFCIEAKKKITLWLKNMNFIFSWWKQYLIYSFTMFIHKISFSSVEDKIHIFVPDCNILYCMYAINIVSMFTLVGRISKQWKSRLGDKHTNFKKHPDHPRRVYFLFTLVITCRGNPQSLVTVWDAFPKMELFLWFWSDRQMSGTFLQLCAHYRAVSRDLDISSTQQCQWVEKEKCNRTS